MIPRRIETQKNRLKSGGRIDRSKTVTLGFDGLQIAAHPGDTLASALLAADVPLIGRSFKYHRPRGVMSAGVEESGALVTIGSGARRTPNMRATVAEAAAKDGARQQKTAAVVAVLAEAQKTGRARVRAAFEEARAGGLTAARALSGLQDAIIQTLFDFVTGILYPRPNPTAAERIALVAVGGYGRGALAPGSDIDLLLVTPYKQTPWGEMVIETMLYALWDLKLKVGHAIRSIDDCLRLGGEDMTIRTSLLETRYLCGDMALYDELRDRLWAELFGHTGKEFAASKLAERKTRHERAGDSRYLLEPNIKEGKGGLRDLQSLFWIAKYIYRTESVADLVAQGVFTAGEAAKFARAEAFLISVRFWLHYLSGRSQDQLTFDLQVEIAAKMKFRNSPGMRPVERFMKRYYLIAKEVGDLTRIFCAALEQQQQAPRRQGNPVLTLLGLGRKDRALDEIALDRGRICVLDETLFARDPVAIMRLFRMAAETGAPVHPATLKLLRRSLPLVDAAFRETPAVNALFLEIITAKSGQDSVLRLMNETGVLGRYIPEFGRIVSMMQFNMYHHYTVDEHTIRAIGELTALERGALANDLPLSTGILTGSINRRVLYVALLLHDIGKGRREDHSVIGAQLAAVICPRLGMSDTETESVVWLVRHHLYMSDTAQKRDIADFRTVADFAAVVQSRERLKLLLVLTVCDIRAVGPGVWNGWKAQLLRQLYAESEAHITAGHDGVHGKRAARVEDAKNRLRAGLASWPKKQIEAFVLRHYPAYWLGLDESIHVEHARMLAAATESDLVLDVTHDPERATSRLYISMADHPGLFSRITGAIALTGANIVDAKSFTTSDGAALATFWLQDSDGEAYDDPARIRRLKDVIARTLRGEIVPREEIREREKTRIGRKREESFSVAPSVEFDNNASELYTLIEVNGLDRLGLVHDLARTFAESNVNIFSAIIATYGERAVDVFYVKDLFGHKITHPGKRAQIEERLLAALRKPKP